MKELFHDSEFIDLTRTPEASTDTKLLECFLEGLKKKSAVSHLGLLSPQDPSPTSATHHFGLRTQTGLPQLSHSETFT